MANRISPFDIFMPIDCVNLPLSGYLKNSHRFLQDSGMEFLEEKTILGFKVVLVEKEGMLAVGFRGTHLPQNWINNAFNQIHGSAFEDAMRMACPQLVSLPIMTPTRPEDHIATLQKTLQEWEEKYGAKIGLFAAHSAGHFFAEYVRWRDDIEIVSFNAQRANKGIHFRTSSDPLTGVQLLVPTKKRFIELGQGGHSLLDCSMHLLDHTWKDFTPEIRNMAQAEKSLDGLKGSLGRLAEKLLKDDQVDVEIKEVAAAGKELKNNIHWGLCALECADTLSASLFQMQQITHSFDQLACEMAGERERVHRFSFSPHRWRAAFLEAGNGFSRRTEDLERSIQGYCKVRDELRRARDSAITRTDAVESIDLSTSKGSLHELEYEVNRKKKKALRSMIGYQALVGISTGILSYSGYAIANPQALNIAGRANQMAQSSFMKDNKRLMDEYQSACRNYSVLGDDVFRLKEGTQRKLRLIEEEMLFVERQLQDGRFDPVDKRVLIQDALDDATARKKRSEQRVARLEAEVEQKKSSLQSAQSTHTHTHQTSIRSSSSKKRSKASKQLPGLQLDAAEKRVVYQESLAALDEEREDQRLQEVHVASLEDQKVDANLLGPYQEWALGEMSRLESVFAPEDKQQRKLYHELTSSFAKIAESRAQRNRLVAAGGEVWSELMDLLDYDQDRFLRNTAGFAYTMYDLQDYFSSMIVPLKMLYDKCEEGAFLDTVGLDNLMTYYCIPALGGLVAGVKFFKWAHRWYMGRTEYSLESFFTKQLHHVARALSKDLESKFKQLDRRADTRDERVHRQLATLQEYVRMGIERLERGMQELASAQDEGRFNDFCIEIEKVHSDMQAHYHPIRCRSGLSMAAEQTLKIVNSDLREAALLHRNCCGVRHDEHSGSECMEAFTSVLRTPSRPICFSGMLSVYFDQSPDARVLNWQLFKLVVNQFRSLTEAVIQDGDVCRGLHKSLVQTCDHILDIFTGSYAKLKEVAQGAVERLVSNQKAYSDQWTQRRERVSSLSIPIPTSARDTCLSYKAWYRFFLWHQMAKVQLVSIPLFEEAYLDSIDGPIRSQSDWEAVGLEEKTILQVHQAPPQHLEGSTKTIMHIYLDLHARKFALGSPTCVNQVPVFDIEIASVSSGFPYWNTEYAVHLAFEKPFQDLCEIEAFSKDPKKYAKRSQEMLCDYFDFLDGNPGDSNHFKEIETTAQLIAEVDGGGVPLLLPKKLIRHLENTLIPSTENLPLDSTCDLIPAYSFERVDNHYELKIFFRFINRDAFCSFSVCSFDALSVHSYRRDLTDDVFDNHDYFLLVALYAGLYKLGLPGEGTKAFGPLIYPVDRPSAGLFKFLDRFPNMHLSHMTSQINDEVVQGLIRASEGLSFDEPVFRQCVHPIRPPQFYEGYLKHWQFDEESLEKQQHRKDYAALTAIVQLLSGYNREVFRVEASESLHIFDELHVGLPVADLLARQQFIEQIMGVPSQCMVELLYDVGRIAHFRNELQPYKEAENE